MNKTFIGVLLTVFVLGTSANNLCDSRVPASINQAKTPLAKWAKYGMSFNVPAGWRKTDEDEEALSYVGPGNLKLSIHVAVYKPEYGGFSIEYETESFYEEHRKAGEEDLRYLEIDGVKGVHYLRDDQTWDARYQMYDAKFIIWNAQRIYKGSRQIIMIRMSSPAGSFSKDRDTLYQILQSIKFAA
jgi:hypothetical protein